MKFGSNKNLTSEILNGTQVTQCFKATENYIESIGIEFATYKRINNCKITVCLTDLYGHVIASDIRIGSKIGDNAMSTFDIKKPVQCGQKYKVIIKSDGSSGNTVSAKYGNQTVGSTFSIGNNVFVGKELCMEINYEKNITYIDKAINETTKQLLKIKHPDINKTVSLLMRAADPNVDKIFESIKKQDYEYKEIIMMADTDTDKDYDGISVKLVNCNSISEAISHSNGEYILPMFDSFLIDKTAISELVKTISKDNLDMIVFAAIHDSKVERFKWDKSLISQAIIRKNSYVEGDDLLESMYLDAKTFKCLQKPMVDVFIRPRVVIRLKDLPKPVGNKKFAVYTCIINNSAKLIIPPNLPEDAQVFCFTDSLDVVDEMPRNVIFRDIDNRKDAVEMCKIVGHRILKNYKYSIWFDSNAEYKTDLTQITKYSGNNTMTIFKAPTNICVYKEFKNCDDSDVKQQLVQYKSEKYPRENGLADTTLMLRNIKETESLMEEWWTEFNKYENMNDQISFGYILWKNKFKKIKTVMAKIKKIFIKTNEDE